MPSLPATPFRAGLREGMRLVRDHQHTSLKTPVLIHLSNRSF